MNMNAPLPPRDHNNPPPIDIESLRDLLKEKNFDLTTRQQDLIAAASRVPDVCETDETAAKISDLVKMMTTNRKALNGQRETEKAPFLNLERAVDGFFNPLMTALDEAKRKVERKLTDYLDRKAAAERAARQAEAKRLQDEADAIAQRAREAEAAQMPQVAAAELDAAVSVEKQAQDASARATEKPAQLAVTHGDYGSRASLRQTKVATIVSREEINLEALRAHLSIDAIQTALNSYMRANWKDDANPPVLKGASFTIRTQAQVR